MNYKYRDKWFLDKSLKSYEKDGCDLIATQHVIYLKSSTGNKPLNGILQTISAVIGY